MGLAPLSQTPDKFAIAMNLLAALFACAAVLVIGLLAGAWGRVAAVAAAVTAISVPLWWKVSAYAHPTWPAIFFFLCAVLSAMQLDGRARRDLKFYLGVIACLTLSFAYRIDTVAMAPMLLGALWQNGKIQWGRAIVLIACGLLAIPLSSVLFGIGLVSGAPTNNELVGMWFRPENFVKFAGDSSFRFIMSANPAIILAASAALWVAICHREWRLLLLTVPVAVLDFMFWIPLGHRERHFLVVIPAIAILIGYAVDFAVAEMGRGSKIAQWSLYGTLVLLVVCSISENNWALYLSALPLAGLCFLAFAQCCGLNRRQQWLTVTLLLCVSAGAVAMGRHRFYNNQIWLDDRLARFHQRAQRTLAEAHGGTLYVISSGPQLAAHILRLRPMAQLSQTPIVVRSLMESDEWLEFRMPEGNIRIYDEGWNEAAALDALLARTKGQPVRVLIDSDVAPQLARAQLGGYNLSKSVM